MCMLDDMVLCSHHCITRLLNSVHTIVLTYVTVFSDRIVLRHRIRVVDIFCSILRETLHCPSIGIAVGYSYLKATTVSTLIICALNPD